MFVNGLICWTDGRRLIICVLHEKVNIKRFILNIDNYDILYDVFYVKSIMYRGIEKKKINKC